MEIETNLQFNLELDQDARKRLDHFSKSTGIAFQKLLDLAIHKGLEKLEKCASSHLYETNIHLTPSPRQRQILALLRTGLSVKEIADFLCVKEVTIRTHISRLRSRLAAHDLLHLRYLAKPR